MEPSRGKMMKSDNPAPDSKILAYYYIVVLFYETIQCHICIISDSEGENKTKQNKIQ